MDHISYILGITDIVKLTLQWEFLKNDFNILEVFVFLETLGTNNCLLSRSLSSSFIRQGKIGLDFALLLKKSSSEYSPRYPVYPVSPFQLLRITELSGLLHLLLSHCPPASRCFSPHALHLVLCWGHREYFIKVSEISPHAAAPCHQFFLLLENPNHFGLPQFITLTFQFSKLAILFGYVFPHCSLERFSRQQLWDSLCLFSFLGPVLFLLPYPIL